MIGPLLDAFVPAIGLIGLGQALRRRGWLSERFWAEAEKLVFYILLPALLVVATATAELSSLPVARLAGAIALGILGGSLLTLALWPALRPDFPGFTSALQGAIRFNNLVGFALAGPLFGAPGLALAALLVGLMVPLINLVCVSAFALGGARFSLAGFLGQLARNPLLVSCLAGFALNLSGIGLPAGLAPLLRALGQGAVALGLMAVGAALTFQALAARLGLQAVVALIKLALVPAMVWLAGGVLGLDPLSRALATLFMGLPTASSAYIMARQMGGDAPLMAAITTSQHLLAVLSLPALILLAGP